MYFVMRYVLSIIRKLPVKNVKITLVGSSVTLSYLYVCHLVVSGFSQIDISWHFVGIFSYLQKRFKNNETSPNQ